MKFSIIIPIYNEEGNIDLLIKRMDEVMAKLPGEFEYIFINDGSKDMSMKMIKEYAAKRSEVRYINFSRNFGHQIAVTAGLDLSEGEYVCIIDADLQDPPELIIDMYNKMLEGYEVVYARRKSRKGESFMKKLTAKVFYRFLKSITSTEIPVDTGDFRMVHRMVVDVFKQMPEHHKYIRGQISWIGFNQTYVEYDRDERHAGETGYSYKKMFQFAIDGVTSFSNFPLKLATMMGFVVSGVSFIVLLFVLYSKFITENYEPGWPSLIVSILFIGGIQLISIGLIGEYIGRINDEVKDRPHYIIRETNIPKETKEI